MTDETGVVILVVSWADGKPSPYDGEYLVSWDVEADDGWGSWKTSPVVEAAHVFPDAAAAFTAWRQASKVHPLRGDGKPNRPLTALTIMVGPAGLADD